MYVNIDTMNELPNDANREQTSDCLNIMFEKTINMHKYTCMMGSNSNILLLHSLIDDYPLATMTLYHDDKHVHKQFKKILNDNDNIDKFTGTTNHNDTFIVKISNCCVGCPIDFTLSYQNNDFKKTLNGDTTYIIRDVPIDVSFNLKVNVATDCPLEFRRRFSRTSWKCVKYIYRWTQLSDDSSSESSGEDIRIADIIKVKGKYPIDLSTIDEESEEEELAMVSPRIKLIINNDFKMSPIRTMSNVFVTRKNQRNIFRSNTTGIALQCGDILSNQCKLNVKFDHNVSDVIMTPELREKIENEIEYHSLKFT